MKRWSGRFECEAPLGYSRSFAGMGPVNTAGGSIEVFRDMEKWTETYTLRQDFPDGSCIRSNGENLWKNDGISWLGNPPECWDESKAVKDDYTTTFEIEGDYS